VHTTPEGHSKLKDFKFSSAVAIPVSKKTPSSNDSSSEDVEEEVREIPRFNSTRDRRSSSLTLLTPPKEKEAENSEE